MSGKAENWTQISQVLAQDSQHKQTYALQVSAFDLFLVLSGSDEAGNNPAKEGSGDEYEKWNKYTCNQTSLATLSLV